LLTLSWVARSAETWVKGVDMTQEPASPVKDKNYDLITVLKVLLRGVWKIETYAKDAEEEGDTELAQWFRKIQDHDRAAAAQGKELLLRRLQAEGG
jgi:hypothetical protein